MPVAMLLVRWVIKEEEKSLGTTPVKVVHVVESKERSMSKSHVMKVEREIVVDEEERATGTMLMKVRREAQEKERAPRVRRQ
jgi:hypothetical protein